MPKKKEATPKKSVMGRPTDYNPEIIKKIDEYLSKTVDVNSLDGFYVNLPTVNDFCQFIGVPKRTVYEWKAKYEDFSHSLDKIVAEQEKRLLNNGLGNKYNAMMAKFILSANHGMSEKTVNTNLNVDVEDESDIDDVLKSNGLI